MLAKTTGTSVFMIGHVTKDGSIAGPRVLEHIVDTVLYLEGDPFQAFRLLRSVKNRFGATSEVGVFEMSGLGMIEVPNPSEAFLAERVTQRAGDDDCRLDGGDAPAAGRNSGADQPDLLRQSAPHPQRRGYNRLLMVSAVLTKRLGLKLHEQDIFINVIGGLKIDEPASDLAMALGDGVELLRQADAAGYGDDRGDWFERRITGGVAAFRRGCTRRAKMGFKRALIPKLRRKLPDLPPEIKLVEVRHVGEAMAIAVPKD